jgi:hypothetical protein
MDRDKDAEIAALREEKKILEMELKTAKESIQGLVLTVQDLHEQKELPVLPPIEFNYDPHMVHQLGVSAETSKAAQEEAESKLKDAEESHARERADQGKGPRIRMHAFVGMNARAIAIDS